MKIQYPNKIRRKIISKLRTTADKLDGSGNDNIEVNGEKNFVDNLIEYYKGQKITIFDIGANVGEYSDLLVSKITDGDYMIHLFEPQKSCVVDLKNKFSTNKNVVINEFGLSEEAGSAIIYRDKDKSGLSSLYKRNLDFFHIKMDDEEKIVLKTAKEYIEGNKIKKIHLIKVDVEGHELKVFLGFGEYLNSDFIDFIQFEYGDASIDAHKYLMDYYKLLIPRGFKICKIQPKHLELREYSQKMETLGYQNFVAISEKVLNGLLG